MWFRWVARHKFLATWIKCQMGWEAGLFAREEICISFKVYRECYHAFEHGKLFVTTFMACLL